MKARMIYPSLFLLLLVVLFFISATPVQASACTWNVASGNWNDLANWSCGKVPGASDDVTISNNGVVTLTINANAASLTLSSGTLTGAANLTAATINWTGGTMSGSGTTTASTALNFSGANSYILDTRTLNNAGTATWNKTSGYLIFANSATLNNQTGATFTITSGSYLFTSAGTFNNAGTFTVNMPGNVGANCGFNNSGTVNVQNGSLEINNNNIASTSSGPYTVQAGAGLKFSGSIDNNLNGAISGNGSVEFGGIGQVRGVYNITGGTTVSSGTTTFYPASTLTSLGPTLTISYGTLDLSSGEAVALTTLNESGGTLTGTDNVTAATINWTGGAMSGSGITTASTALNFSGTNSSILDTRTLNNAGAATWTKTDGYLAFVHSATFNNQTGKTFTVTSSGYYLITGAGTFNNAGIFTVNMPGNTISMCGFNNSGTVNVQSGSLEINNNDIVSTSSGAYHVQAGAGLKFSGSIDNNLNGAINGSGSVEFTGIGQVRGVYNITGATTVSSGTTTFYPAATLTSLGSTLTIGGTLNLSSGEAVSLTTLNLNNGTLTGTDNVTAATINWPGGTMSGSGTTTASTALNFSSSGSAYLDTRTLNNAGSVNWTKTSSQLNFQNSATFNNQTGATFTVTASGSFLFYGAGTFNNAGTFTLNIPGNTISACGFNNSGTVNVQSGSLEINNNDIVSTSSGAYHVQAGAGLKFSGSVDNNLNGPISGSGSVEFAGIGQVRGVYNITGGTTVSSGTTTFYPAATLTSLGPTLTISYGTLDLSSGEAVNLTTLNESNGTLTGADNVTAATINWLGGTMSGSGTTTASTALNFNSNNSVTITLDNHTLNNAGVATWTKTDGDLTFANAATFNNKAGATFTVTSSGTYLFNGAGTFDNAGTLNLTTGYISNITTFEQEAGGVTNLAISGTTLGTQYTQIGATNFILAGPLNISFTGGYTPQIGDYFILLSYSNVPIGAFKPITLPNLSGGFWYLNDYQNTLKLWAFRTHQFFPIIMN